MRTLFISKTGDYRVLWTQGTRVYAADFQGPKPPTLDAMQCHDLDSNQAVTAWFVERVTQAEKDGYKTTPMPSEMVDAIQGGSPIDQTVMVCFACVEPDVIFALGDLLIRLRDTMTGTDLNIVRDVGVVSVDDGARALVVRAYSHDPDIASNSKPSACRGQPQFVVGGRRTTVKPGSPTERLLLRVMLAFMARHAGPMELVEGDRACKCPTAVPLGGDLTSHLSGAELRNLEALLTSYSLLWVDRQHISVDTSTHSARGYEGINLSF